MVKRGSNKEDMKLNTHHHMCSRWVCIQVYSCTHSLLGNSYSSDYSTPPRFHTHQRLWTTHTNTEAFSHKKKTLCNINTKKQIKIFTVLRQHKPISMVNLFLSHLNHFEVKLFILCCWMIAIVDILLLWICLMVN